jgi:hypothetical protein
MNPNESAGNSKTARLRGCARFAAAVFPLLAIMQAGHAMQALDDGELGRESGTGIAIALQNLQFQMAPTSYIEATPSSTNLPAGLYSADLRWYGLSMTGSSSFNSANGNAQWDNSSGGCGSLSDGSNICPQGTVGVADFASVYNPYVLRVFNYAGYNFAGTLLTQGAGAGYTAPTVLELRGPTNMDTFRWSFWGALTVNATGPGGNGAPPPSPMANCPGGAVGNTGFCGLQSQVIIDGKPVAMVGGVATPTVLQLFTIPAVNDNHGTGDSTLGIVYQSALSGNFRLGVEQVGAANTPLTTVPLFDNQEGMYFKNVNAYLPMGYLNQQAITLSSAGTTGNFVIELTRVSSVANAYNDFYCGATSCTADANGIMTSTPNPRTHGFVDWGTYATGGGAGTNYNDIVGTNTTQGIYFDAPATASTTSATLGTITNIGTAHISGILFQHLMITSCGAGATSPC